MSLILLEKLHRTLVYVHFQIVPAKWSKSPEQALLLTKI